MQFYAFPSPSLSFDDETFVSLQEAIHRKQVVHLRYHAQHSNRITERDIEPSHMVFLDKAWMLVGYCRLREGERIFRLDRIDHLHITDEHFIPQHLPDKDRMHGDWQVRVRFSPDIVRWVQERNHFSHVSSETTRDGGMVALYQPRSLEQIQTWLLKWGTGMEVLAPPELRRMIAETAVLITKRHRTID